MIFSIHFFLLPRLPYFASSMIYEQTHELHVFFFCMTAIYTYYRKKQGKINIYKYIHNDDLVNTHSVDRQKRIIGTYTFPCEIALPSQK